MIIRNDIIEEILDLIEEKETKLLVWGIVDVYLTRNEVDDCIIKVIDNFNDLNTLEDDPSKVLEELIKRNLIFYVDLDNQKLRSRMAETIRLIYHLRQMFPKHANQNWQNAPTLVSDFRFIRRRRSVPKRGTNPSELLSKLNDININFNIKKSVKILSKDMNLANFQIRSTKIILESLSNEIVSGNLISAGTGSGKTLGFYFASLSQIASNILSKSSDYWLQCLSIYPRTELLKDQINSIYKEARKLDDFLISNSKRKISLGALYGEVPQDNNFHNFDGTRNKWKSLGDDYICPFLICIKCSSKLLWKKNNLDQGIEKLTCHNSSCGFETGPDEIMLTRKTMLKTPPDILFTTTEMLNQNTSEVQYHKLFGITRTRLKPQMILLDEIHTYSGTHGAQIAYLIRRLREMIKSKITFVALSATLVDGARFLSKMIKVPENKVNIIEPFPEEMDHKGAEYLLAVKGDPISKSALLSTTIQTNMLLSRMLDPHNDDKSNGFFGKKLFSFTDDLDVVNRLYHSSLDSEGRNYKGFEVGSSVSLASLRNPDDLSNIKNNQGQVWKIPSKIQNDPDLSKKKKIVRVSRQDPGTQSDAEIVVATSKLEVGVDDPDVGAVVQHKSPREFASFLQRKGRAGRAPYMRPWTVVVLSDFGRDKLSYQSYDMLFNPQMKIQPLPLKSQYVQKMQATYCLLDYLCLKLKFFDNVNFIKGIDIWRDLSKPNNSDANVRRIKILNQTLHEILNNLDELERFKLHLCNALDLNEEELKSILWEFPRPIMTVVIPTAIRRLETNWKLFLGQDDTVSRGSPLPEFIPSALFDDLNLPDVIIDFSLTDQNQENETMPIFQALKTFAPGRVSRRFGVQGDFAKHWVINESEGVIRSEIELNESYEFYYNDEWDYIENDQQKKIKVYRPTKIKVEIPKYNVVDTSNSLVNWITSFSNFKAGIDLNTPKKTKLSDILTNIKIFTHSDQCPIIVQRFFKDVNANIRYKNGDELRETIHFKHNEQNVGLGFDVSVDALKFSVSINISEIFNEINTKKSLEQSLRVSKFFDDIKNEKIFNAVKNPFLRNWLGEIYYNLLILESIETKTDLKTVNLKILSKETKLTFNDLLNNFFQSHFIENEDDNEENLSVDETKTDKLRIEIENYLNDKDVLHHLAKVASCLWESVDDTWSKWIEEKYFLTIASGVMNALEHLCKDFDVEDLVLDLIPKIKNENDNSTNNDRFFIISEKTPGGVGVIENFIKLYSADPRKFYSLIENMFVQNDYELTDYQLRKFLEEINDEENHEMRDNISNFRLNNSYDEKLTSSKNINKFLIKQNYVPYHGFITALFNRILRPGSNPDTDYFLLKLITKWRDYEEETGVEIDTKLMCFIYRNDSELISILEDLGFDLPSDNQENWRFNVLQSILWLRGRVVRNKHLDLYNPFAQYRDPEILLISHIFKEKDNRINHRDDQKWYQEFKSLIETKGDVVVAFDETDKENIQDFLNYLIVNPMESEYLLVYARVHSIARVKHRYHVHCEIAENLQ